MASLSLIRHGQASFGSENYDQLSELGRRQADVSGEYFAEIGLNFDQAYCGNLSRQVETAERVLARQVQRPKLIVDQGFNEVDNEGQIVCLLPELVKNNSQLNKVVEGASTDTKRYQKLIQAVFNAWVSPDCPVMSETASWADYRKDVCGALQSAMASAKPGSDTAVFTSGGTIATAVSWVLGCTHDQIYKFYEPVFNCSITTLLFSENRVSLSNFNDISHLRLIGRQLDEVLVTYR